uniref:Uncharacterized protein n=1 Tax=Peronospora matthiolae TaxID=2874970 RepID=A0AAV1TR08_9STRA
MTREAVVNTDQELWFFKLPKSLDASALANVTFKVGEENVVVKPGKLLAKVTAGEDNKKYVLQSEDRMLTDQLVNALPLASDRSRFVLGKPFSRCFSLVEDWFEAPSTVSEKKTTESETHKSKKVKHKK